MGVGPGSQPPEADGARLEYLDLPRGFETYRGPTPADGPRGTGDLAGATGALQWLQAVLDAYVPGGAPRVMDLSHLGLDDRAVVHQVLGEGEVSIRYQGDFEARIQESVLPGVWRSLVAPVGDAYTRELLEVCPIPELARRRPEAGPTPTLGVTGLDSGAANARAILVELEDRLAAYRAGSAPHTVNLSLLPLSQEDRDLLERALGEGPVRILSRGYGDCRIGSTAVPGVWWVRYHNAMDRVVLDTIEVVDVPAAACAAAEDIGDSARRLREILEAYGES